jgi:hypothetical protein
VLREPLGITAQTPSVGARACKRGSYLLQNKQALAVRGCLSLRLFGGLDGRLSLSSIECVDLNASIGQGPAQQSVFREASGGMRRSRSGRKLRTGRPGRKILGRKPKLNGGWLGRLSTIHPREENPETALVRDFRRQSTRDPQAPSDRGHSLIELVNFPKKILSTTQDEMSGPSPKMPAIRRNCGNV